MLESINAEAPRRTKQYPGEVLLTHNLAAEALPHLLASAKEEPTQFGHQVNLSIAYRKLGRYEDSRQHLVNATRLAPDAWPVFHAWGQLLEEVGKFEDGLKTRWKAWELCKATSQEVAFGLAWAMLRQGAWLKAWPFYEAGRFMRSWAPPPALKVWNGDDIKGMRLLVIAEGGYGDTFMFSRWIPNLYGSGIKVTLYVWDKQVEILKTSPELQGIDFLPMSEQVDTANYDLVTSVMSLPALMQATPETLPPPIRFHVTPWERNGARRMGLCWSAEEFGTPRKIRSIPGQRVEILSTVEAEWFSLVPGQRFAWTEPCKGNWLEDAALIESLDTVVTVDTACAHLAGCLGVPTILLVPVGSAWPWMLGREDTPWYPGMTIVRQKTPDRWDDVIGEVRGLLNGR